MVKKQRYAVFYGEFENEKKKGQKFLTFRSGDLNPRFSVIFPPMIWIFMESVEPEIKSKQASKRDRTLRGFLERFDNQSEVLGTSSNGGIGKDPIYIKVRHFY